MNFVALRGNAQRFRAAPGDWTHISIFLIVPVENKLFGGVDLGDRIGNLEIQNARRIPQPFAVLGASENLAAIGALAFEHAARIMQPVREHADLGFGGRDQLAVEPDQVGTLVEGHCHGNCLPRVVRPNGLRIPGRDGAFAPKPQTGYGLRRFLRRSWRACTALLASGTKAAALPKRHCPWATRPRNDLALAT